MRSDRNGVMIRSGSAFGVFDKLYYFVFFFIKVSDATNAWLIWC